jgi:putative ABC transport system ATP-binding protein
MQAAAEAPTDTAAARALGVTKVYGQGGGAVTALDDVSVGFGAGTFTAIMGPSGSGKSTLLHLLGGLDRPTRGQIHLQGHDLSDTGQRALTVLRRDRIGVVFQPTTCCPPSPSPRTSGCRWRWRGASRTRPGWNTWSPPSAWPPGSAAGRRSCPAGSSNASPSLGRWSPGRRCSWPTSPPALDSATGADLLALLQATCRDTGQTIVMVTHDPRAACSAQRIVFLADGRVTGELTDPTPDAVLGRIRRLER